MTPFEQRLADTPHREIPPELRARILAAARPFRISHFAFQIFAWPHPLAWAAVAAAWVVIAVLNFSGPRGPELYAVTPKNYKGRLPSAAEYLAQYTLQRRLIASLSSSTLDSQLIIYYPRGEKL